LTGSERLRKTREASSLSPMLVLRSLAFAIAFYANITLWMICALPTLLLPRRALVAVVRAWARSNLALLRILVGIRCEVRGRERIPPGGLLVASKHQSVWETFALFLILDDPCYVLKRELIWLPLFGWLARKARMVPVDRGARSAAMKSMTAAALIEVEARRQIVIFPEGTRRAPGAEPAYKFGVAYLYSELNVPCLPIALDSGLFWPRRQVIKRPGTIVVEVLEPIPPGLERNAFLERIIHDIEGASNRLLDEVALNRRRRARAAGEAEREA
jgi:1-acyl-sn-glycerol-3-phosphate acyltransferase